MTTAEARDLEEELANVEASAEDLVEAEAMANKT